MIHHVFEEQGKYNVRLVCEDEDGDRAEAYQLINVGYSNADEELPRRKIIWDRLEILNEETVKSGKELKILVDFKNNGEEKLEDVRIEAISYDLPARTVIGRITAKPGETVDRLLIMDIPKDALPGKYDIRVTISNEDIRRVKHRLIEVI